MKCDKCKLEKKVHEETVSHGDKGLHHVSLCFSCRSEFRQHLNNAIRVFWDDVDLLPLTMATFQPKYKDAVDNWSLPANGVHEFNERP